MMLASELLTRVRYGLSDIDVKRYTDTRLLILLNDAINDIAKNTILFTEIKQLAVSNNVVDYDLSAIMTTLVRAEYLDEPLDVKTFEEMDAFKSTWQLDKGDKPKCLVYGKQKRGEYKLYPVVENAVNGHITYNQLEGIITGITYSDIQPIIADVVGDLAGIPTSGIIKLYYIRKHPKVTATSDTLYVDELVMRMLEDYIVGMALLDNQDSQNIALGNGKLKLYYQMAAEYTNSREQGFTREDLEVPYNGGITQ